MLRTNLKWPTVAIYVWVEARLGLVGGLVDPVYTPHRKPAGLALGGAYCLD